jgi:predicted NodU family carbamoyl transferase
MSEHDGAASLVRSDALLAALSRRLDERMKGFEGVPDSVHNRAVRNAVQVVADCVAIAASDIRIEANNGVTGVTTAGRNVP